MKRATRPALAIDLAQPQSLRHVFLSRVCAVGLSLLCRPSRAFPRSSIYQFRVSPHHNWPRQELSTAVWTMATKRKAPATDEGPKLKSRAISSFFSKEDGPAAPPKINFDKDAWAKTLTDEQRGLLKLELETMDLSWLAELKGVLVSEQFLALKRFLETEKKSGQVVFPAEQDIYSWSRHCPLYSVKVIILGQDPYRMFPILRWVDTYYSANW